MGGGGGGWGGARAPHGAPTKSLEWRKMRRRAAGSRG
ncbi:hypothetical protein QF010_006640, partial [Pseudomonas silensiensis]